MQDTTTPAATPPDTTVGDQAWPAAIGNPEGRPDRTDEFSFLLRPCAAGVGVFAAHPIRKGAYLRLDNDPAAIISRKVPRREVPGEFIKYCIAVDDEHVLRPLDFGRLEVVWFLNHSDTPNAAHVDYVYHATRDIAAGEEITVDYTTIDQDR